MDGILPSVQTDISLFGEDVLAVEYLSRNQSKFFSRRLNLYVINLKAGFAKFFSGRKADRAMYCSALWA